ncbi:MAG: hypothetical protein QM722_00380 [Piscinibacter sp.]
MLKCLMTATVAVATLAALGDVAEARHRRRSLESWCRADAAQMMGISRRAIALAPLAAAPGGRYEMRGVASHGRFGTRAFTCQFDQRRVLQGAV